MKSENLLKAGILAIFLVATCVISREFWLRYHGYSVSYDDSGPLWSEKRGRVYQPKDKAVVFIGSSRIKFDLDIPTWEKSTGLEGVQLAFQGTNPLPVLDNLAADKKFCGKLVIDVSEILFFSLAKPNLERAEKNIDYYKNYTPSQKASFQINHVLESNLVLLDQDYFSLNATLNHLPVAKRKDVFPGLDFPWAFDKCNFSRQSVMDDRFLKDSNLQNQVRGIWAMIGKMSKEPPPSGKKLDSIMNSVKVDVDKIKARGGEVIFVRTPSSGPFLQGEEAAYPRKNYWDRLLAITGCDGIYFKDYEPIAHFQCPEFSHLKPSDAKTYTTYLVELLQEKKFIGRSMLAYHSWL